MHEATLLMVTMALFGQCPGGQCPVPIQQSQYILPKQPTQLAPAPVPQGAVRLQPLPPKKPQQAQQYPKEKGKRCIVRCWNGPYGGTGGVIGHDKTHSYIITVKHLFKNDGGQKYIGPVRVQWEGLQKQVGQCVALHPNSDLAIIKTARPSPDSLRMIIGDAEYNSCSTCGYGQGLRRWRCWRGRRLRGQRWVGGHVEFTGEPRQGDSGSPVWDERGHYVGTLWGGSHGSTMMTPVSIGLPFLQQHLPGGSYRLASTVAAPAEAPSSAVASVPTPAPTQTRPLPPRPRKLENEVISDTMLVKALNQRIDAIQKQVALLALSQAQQPRQACLTPEDVAEVVLRTLETEGLFNEIRRGERSLLTPGSDGPGPDSQRPALAAPPAAAGPAAGSLPAGAAAPAAAPGGDSAGAPTFAPVDNPTNR